MSTATATAAPATYIMEHPREGLRLERKIDPDAWVKRYLGDVVHKRLILTHHKNLNHGDFLVDDRPTHRGADRFVGELLHFGSDEFPDWPSVAAYLRTKA